MKIVTIAVVVSLILFAFNRTKTTPDTLPKAIPSPTITTTTEHPLSISNLSSRSFPFQKFKTVKTVSSNTQVVSYLSGDLTLKALMITPSGTPPTNGWPVVIVNHGYIPPEKYSVTNSYINTSRYFASQGFLVLKPDYRGHDQSEGESSNRLFSRSEYTIDVLSLIGTIDSIPTANTNKIFMYGHSMGGDVTLQVLESSSRVAGATLWAPAVTNLPDQVTHFFNKSKPDQDQKEKFKSQYDTFTSQYPTSQISSFENLDRINAPLNLHHGTLDESVPYSWGVALGEKLTTAGKTVNFYSYVGDNHDIARNFSKALSRDAEFFKSLL